MCEEITSTYTKRAKLKVRTNMVRQQFCFEDGSGGNVEGSSYEMHIDDKCYTLTRCK